MKRQGKVKSIRVKEVAEGMQVVTHSKRVVTLRQEPKQSNEEALSWAKCITHTLKTLVVEYERELDKYIINPIVQTFSPHREIKQLPLKYRQWQSAIDNGEVDSNKIVEFEIIGKSIYNQYKHDSKQHFNAPIEYAKIIPYKEKIYTETQVYELLRAFGFRFSIDHPKIDAWWEKNK